MIVWYKNYNLHLCWFLLHPFKKMHSTVTLKWSVDFIYLSCIFHWWNLSSLVKIVFLVKIGVYFNFYWKNWTGFFILSQCELTNQLTLFWPLIAFSFQIWNGFNSSPTKRFWSLITWRTVCPYHSRSSS